MIKRATSLIISLQILLFILSFQLLAYARAEVISLSPIDDAYVSSLYPNVKRGSDKQLVLADYKSRDVDVKILVYIKFDLSNIPSNVEITSAKLELCSMSVTMPSQISIHHCASSSWNEREITYANAPPKVIAPTSSIYVVEANTWYSWDLTSDVRNARGDQLTEVLQMNSSSEPNHVSFYSKEASDSSYRPRLEIEYVSPKVSTSETTSFVTEEKTHIAPLPPPGTVEFSIFWVALPIIVLCIFAVGALYLTRSRRGAGWMKRVKEEGEAGTIVISGKGREEETTLGRTALVSVCPRCNTENPTGNKFCQNCGVRLEYETEVYGKTPDSEREPFDQQIKTGGPTGF